MTKRTGPSLGWKLRETVARDPRWSPDTLSLSRPMDPASFETPSRQRLRGTCLHTVTFTRGKTFAIINADLHATDRVAATVTEIEASLRASGYDGAWSVGPNRASGVWMRNLSGVREAAAELSRTAPGTERSSPDVRGIRGLDALLDTARAGAFGPLQFYATYSCEESLRAGRASTTLRLVLSAEDRGTAFTFASTPVRAGVADRSTMAAQLERLHLNAVWTKVPGAGFMLSGGLPPLDIGRPRTSIEEVVAASAAVQRWAKDKR